jgi:hypothetical protein
LLGGTRLVVDVGELSVTIRVVRAFPELARALQAVVQRMQHFGHGRVTDLMALAHQLGRQLTGEGGISGPCCG